MTWGLCAHLFGFSLETDEKGIVKIFLEKTKETS